MFHFFIICVDYHIRFYYTPSHDTPTIIGNTLAQMKRIANHDKGWPTYNYHGNLVCVDSCDDKLVSLMGTSLTL